MAVGLRVSKHSPPFPPLPQHSATCLLDPAGHNRPETRLVTFSPNPRSLSPFPALPTALAQKLSPGGAAKKPKLAAETPHITHSSTTFPLLGGWAFAHWVCLLTHASALMEDSWGPSYRL